MCPETSGTADGYYWAKKPEIETEYLTARLQMLSMLHRIILRTESLNTTLT